MVGATFTLGSLAALAEARADAPPPKSARLRYDRSLAPACPAEESFRNAVTTRLGYDPFVTDGGLTISVSFARTSKGALAGRVDVATEGGKPAGHRELVANGDDCAELAASLSVAVSIAIDPQSFGRDPKPPPEPLATTPAPEPTPVPPPSHEAVPVPKPPAPRDQAHIALAVSAIGTFAATPRPLLGPALEVALRFEHVSLAVDVRSEFAVGTASVNHAAVYTYAPQGTLFACGHPGGSLRGMAICADLSAGALVVSTSSGSAPASEPGPFALLGPRFAYEYPLSESISLRAAADVRLALASARIRFENTEIWRSPSPVVPSVALGMVAHFW